MTDIARRLGEDWEVKCDWPGGNWTKTPSQNHLPIHLRKKQWPRMVGIAITANEIGPKGIMIGIAAPTKQEWDTLKKHRDNKYGDRDRFIDVEERKIIEDAVKPARKGWWAYWEDYKIKDWTNVDALIQLHNNKEEVMSDLGRSINSLADKMIHLHIP